MIHPHPHPEDEDEDESLTNNGKKMFLQVLKIIYLLLIQVVKIRIRRLNDEWTEQVIPRTDLSYRD